jgi:hypothetical protein
MNVELMLESKLAREKNTQKAPFLFVSLSIKIPTFLAGLETENYCVMTVNKREFIIFVF